MASFSLTDSQHVVITIAATDKKGNPTSVTPGSVTWLVDNPNVATLTPATDGLSCDVAAVGPLGAFIVTVNATIGTAAVSGTLACTVVSGAATQITLTPGTPAEQP